VENVFVAAVQNGATTSWKSGVLFSRMKQSDFFIEEVLVVSNAFGTIEAKWKNRLYCVMLLSKFLQFQL
jgi:hypothetical protein